MLSTRTLARVGALLLCLGLVSPVGSTYANHLASPGPIHAGNTFGWYPALWRDEFVGPLRPVWHKSGRGDLRTKNGMLTLTGAATGSVSATLAMTGHATGRWEVRMKAR